MVWIYSLVLWKGAPIIQLLGTKRGLRNVMSSAGLMEQLREEALAFRADDRAPLVSQLRGRRDSHS